MSNLNQTNTFVDSIIRMIFLLIIIVWCILILHPFASVLLWSIILTLALLPLHRKLTKKFGDKPKVASFILVATILLIVIVPIFIMITALTKEIIQLKSGFFTESFVMPLPDEKIKTIPLIGSKLYETWMIAATDKETFIMSHKDQLIEYGAIVIKGIAGAVGGVIQLVLALCIAGILLVRNDIGIAMRHFFNKIAGVRGDEFADLSIKTVGTVLKGVLGEGFVLAILHAIVFVLADVPYPGALTLLVFVFAVMQIPVFLVTIPVIMYFFITKETMPAVLWTGVLTLVTLSDNVLTPLMLGKGAPVPIVVIFIGVLGGFVLSGFIGLFTGAIVMSLGYKLFLEWIKPTDLSVKE
jgi:predicted PurR-regulated permease PerM